MPEMNREDAAYVEAFCERNGDDCTAPDGNAPAKNSNWKIEIVDGKVVSIEFWA